MLTNIGTEKGTEKEKLRNAKMLKYENKKQKQKNGKLINRENTASKVQHLRNQIIDSHYS